MNLNFRGLVGFYIGYKLAGLLLGFLAVVGLMFFALSGSKQQSQKAASIANNPITLTSSAFANGQILLAAYACNDMAMPALSVSNITPDTTHLAVWLDDLDSSAAVVNYWTVWNIPVTGNTVQLTPLPVGSVSGNNAFGSAAYRSPCKTAETSPEKQHRYRFKVYALSKPFTYSQSTDSKLLFNQIASRKLGDAELIVLY
jgi:Raf kinase inhibitor-like YbhB/YbcL family protein